jgi:hypothetical protein
VYDVVDVPQTETRTRESGPNPYAEGVANARKLMEAAPGKGLRFVVKAGDAAAQISLLRRAGAAAGVTVRIQSYNGESKLESSLKVYGKLDAATEITLIFWTVPKIKREKKTETDTPAVA